MTSLLLWRILGVFVLFVTAIGFTLAEIARREDLVRQRVLLVQGRGRTELANRSSRLDDTLNAVRRLGGLIIESRLLSRKAAADLEQTLAAAGYRSATALPLVVGSKIVSMTALPLIAWLVAGGLGFEDTGCWLAAIGAAAVGMLLPDIVISRLRDRYLASVERGLPDALDLMVICADAGLPLETALSRVAMEFSDSDPATANELSLAAGEMRVLPDRRQALINLGVRTGLDSMIALGGTLAQTLQYGTPLTQALRVLSAELRHTMLMRFEERAARLPILLTLPMICFFLPCVIIVVLAPAGVRAYHMTNG